MCPRTLTLDEAIAQAKAGMPQVQWSLALLYATGKASVQPDPEQALYWCSQAAHNGHPYAQANLAYCFTNGLFVTADRVQATYWQQKADAHPSPNKPLTLVNALLACVPHQPQPTSEPPTGWESASDLQPDGAPQSRQSLPADLPTDLPPNLPPDLPPNLPIPLPENHSETMATTGRENASTSSLWPNEPPSEASEWAGLTAQPTPPKGEPDFDFAMPEAMADQSSSTATALTDALAATYAFMPDPEPEPEPEASAAAPEPQAEVSLKPSKPHQESLPPMAPDAIEALFREAEQAMNTDPEVGVQKLALASRYGHAKAQFTYAHCLEFGLGVTEDLKSAAYWYHEAVDQGLPDAMINLGAMIEDGRGVLQNLQRAAQLYRQAADLGDYRGMNNLALLYQFGKGVEKNSAEAIKWFEQAADLGDTGAMINLGTMAERGDGIAPNFETAMAWYSQAAQLGNPKAQLIVGKIYLNGSHHIGPDAVMAGQWLARAADQGNADAQYELGRLFERGTETIPPNSELAAQWYVMAANKGQPEAQYALIFFCGKGLGGIEIDPAEAYKWAVLAAEKNTLNATELRDEIGAAITTDELMEGKARAEAWKAQNAWQLL